ncbi:MAG: Na+/H+ antiporter subunit E [Pseudomonadota bacterium]|jgi:multicomponent Na+:H+ antiporter subunit E
MTRVLGLAVMLAAFWLLLSGHYTPLLLAFGASSVLLVTWLAHRMDIVDHEGRPLELSLRAPGYWVWLAGQILLSAVDLGRRIWAPQPRIAPVVRATAVSDMSDVERVTYANSITLTPGTLAMNVEESTIEVHAVDPALIDELDAGAMAAKVRRMGLG